MSVHMSAASRVPTDNKDEQPTSTKKSCKLIPVSRVSTQPQLTAALSSTNQRAESIVVVNVVLLFPSHGPYVSFMLICSSPDFNVLYLNQIILIQRGASSQERRVEVPTVYISLFCVVHRDIPTVILVFTHQLNMCTTC